MRVMVLVPASKESEAGIMPELREQADRLREQISKTEKKS